jgi:protein tyrosine phosphatase domain-containing protein 1
MDYVTGTEGRKILVHCHAGLGRTGLAIACFFLYNQQYGGRRAVEAVRKDRPGALQTKQQEMFVYIFEQYLAHLRCVFSGAELAQEERRAASPTKQRTKTPTPGRNGATSSSGAAGGLSTHGGVQSTSAMGTPEEVHESGGTRHEKYASGLQIVRPVNLPTPGVAANSLASITEDDIGLDHQLPWTSNFHIQPNMVGALPCSLLGVDDVVVCKMCA